MDDNFDTSDDETTMWVDDKQLQSEGDPQFRFGNATLRPQGLHPILCSNTTDPISYEDIEEGDNLLVRTTKPHGQTGQCYHTKNDGKQEALKEWIKDGQKIDPYTSTKIPHAIAHRLVRENVKAQEAGVAVLRAGEHSIIRFVPYADERSKMIFGFEAHLIVRTKGYTAVAYFQNQDGEKETVTANHSKPAEYSIGFRNKTYWGKKIEQPIYSAIIVASVAEIESDSAPNDFDAALKNPDTHSITETTFTYDVPPAHWGSRTPRWSIREQKLVKPHTTSMDTDEPDNNWWTSMIPQWWQN